MLKVGDASQKIGNRQKPHPCLDSRDQSPRVGSSVEVGMVASPFCGHRSHEKLFLLITLGRKQVRGNTFLSLFLSTSKTPASAFHWGNSTRSYLTREAWELSLQKSSLVDPEPNRGVLAKESGVNRPSTSVSTPDWFLCHRRAGVEQARRILLVFRQSHPVDNSGCGTDP